MNTQELIIAANADLEAAKRYRELARKNPTLRRDYLRRAENAQLAGEVKLETAKPTTAAEAETLGQAKCLYAMESL